jgi:hypothetical protein
MVTRLEIFLDDYKPTRADNDNSFGYSKAAINNFMSNSQNKADPAQQDENDADFNNKIGDNNQQMKSNTKLNTFGNPKNSVLKELLQMKQENNKLFKAYIKDHNDLIQDEGVQPASNSLKNRKMSAENYNTDRNNLKEAKQTNRSRKSNSSKPTNRVSRADSRDTSTRSNKEDKQAADADLPANNQVPAEVGKDNVNEDLNIVTKFAFATRVGYIPNNPYKVNQDAYILAPNIMKLPAFHYFGVCDGHGQNGKEVSGYVKQRLPVLLESLVKTHGDDK